MKTFTKDNVTYSVKEDFGSSGIQYKASYEDGTEAYVFIPEKNHTRQEVVNAIDEINSSKILQSKLKLNT